MKLRDYQEEAVGVTRQYLIQNKDKNPCIVIPTGGGKTPIIAQICKNAVTKGSRVLIVAHRKELLIQSFNHLDDHLDVGLYSAGLKSRDTENQIIVAGIQSIYKRGAELGRFDLILIDEAHLIPHSGEGMYQTLLSTVKVVNPSIRLIGLTATPYRLTTGLLCREDGILNDISYEIGVYDLIEAGYLCPLVSKGGVAKARADVSSLHVRAGEYIESEAQEMMDTDTMVNAAVSNIKLLTEGRRKVLIFACGVAHGKHVAGQLRKRDGYKDEGVREVYGETLLRDQEIEQFKNDPSVKFMVNCDVLTIGFDYPQIDCVVLLRPTCSPGYYYQMCGRGLRIHPDKDDCLILDYGENIIRHGPIDQVRPVAKGEGKMKGKQVVKECPQCHAYIEAGYVECPECDYSFAREISHDTVAGDAEIISGVTSFEEYDVSRTNYYAHSKEKENGEISLTMRVEYQTGFNSYEKEWICIEHKGWARDRAVKWWSERSNAACPDTVWEAVQLANDGALCDTKAVKVKSVSGDKFNSIVAYDLGDKPQYAETFGDSYDWGEAL